MGDSRAEARDDPRAGVGVGHAGYGVTSTDQLGEERAANRPTRPCDKDVHIGLLWCYGWWYGLAGVTVSSAREWSPAWRASSKASDSGPPWARVGWFSWTALRALGGQPNGYDPRSLFLALLRDRRFLGVAGVQDHRQEAGPGLAARVPGHPVHRSRRLVERIPGLVGLDRLVVEGVLVLALQDVAEHRAGVAVRRILLAGLEGHFYHRRTGSLPVQLLDDVPLGQLGHLHGLVVVVGRKRNAHSHTNANRER